MRQTILFLGAIFALINFTSTSAQAAGRSGGGGGFFIDETFFPIMVNKNDTSSFYNAPGVATESGTGYDFRTTLGYVFGGSYVVGLTYNMYSLTTSRASVVSGDSGMNEKTIRSEMGPTVGYINNGWRVLLTYFISGDKSFQRKDLDDTNAVTNDATIKNTKLSGLQLSLGYTIALGSSFEIGPSLVYTSRTYSNQSRTDITGLTDYADTELYTKALDSTLAPMISMQIRF
jgi:hypothetical protein